MKKTKTLSLILALAVIMCTVLSACATATDYNSYTVLNSTSSDASGIASALNATYKLVDSASVNVEGKNIIVCISENGNPFDLNSFNDEGYIIRRMGDDFIICAKNETACDIAINYFKKQFIMNGQIVFAAELNYVHGQADRLGTVTVDGVNIEEYKIVIPADSKTNFPKYVANIFSDYLYDAGGISVEVVTDETAESEYEILVGDTNRVTLPENEYGLIEYYLGVSGNDIVLDGEGYLVGAGFGKLIADYLSPEDCGDVDLSLEVIDAIGVAEYEAKEAKNAILMIGDGMGYNHVGASYSFGYLDADYGGFFAEQLPCLGSAKTDSLDGTTDSAAASTALSTGYKTLNNYLGLDNNLNIIQNVRELAYDYGARTAVVTTDTMDGATPAGFLVHSSHRYDLEQVEGWYPKITCEYARANSEFALDDDTIEALSIIGESGDPFFMMVEEAHIDKYSHGNDFVAFQRVVNYNDTIEYVMAYVACHTNTVLLITADHETGGITVNRKGNYKFTSFNHTSADVPVYGIGYGTEVFNNATFENIAIPTFIAKIFGNNEFGHLG